MKKSLAEKSNTILEWVVLFAFIGVLITVASIIWQFGKPVAEGSDASGYIHNSKLLLEGKITTDIRPIENLPLDAVRLNIYQPLGFVVDKEAVSMKPTYSFGVSIVFAFFQLFSSTDIGVLLALVFIGCSGPLGMLFLSRELGLEKHWSYASACIFALSPLYLYRSMLAASDAWSACLAIYCTFFALVAHRRAVYAILLGVCFSLAMLTRMPNFLILLPVGVAFCFRLREQRWWWAVFLGGLPGILLLFWINNTLWGSPFSSGYANIWRLFKFEYFGMTMEHFAKWLTVLHTPVITLGFVASIFLTKKSPKVVLLIWSWVIAFVVFYAFYYHSHQTWWFMRFILPALPPMILGAMFFLRYLSTRFGPSWMPVGVSLVAGAFVCFSEVAEYKGKISFTPRGRNSYLEVVEWVENNAKPGDVFLTMQNSGTLFYYTDHPIIRYNHLKENDWERVKTHMKTSPVTLYAALFEFEIEKWEVLSKRAPGNWTEIEKKGRLSVFRLDP